MGENTTQNLEVSIAKLSTLVLSEEQLSQYVYEIIVYTCLG